MNIDDLRKLLEDYEKKKEHLLTEIHMALVSGDQERKILLTEELVVLNRNIRMITSSSTRTVH